MKLHHNIKLFSDTLRAASQHLDIKLEFVEKDYWITLVLSRLSKSKYIDESVFKGGTSLSKGYNLIERFSEDVDIAIINNKGKTGNEMKPSYFGVVDTRPNRNFVWQSQIHYQLIYQAYFCGR
jgi:predicted nucleotidyltransferase component of viral defense system